jgi:cell division protein FtsQ
VTATIDPRIRERRIEVKREAGRKRLRILLAFVAALSAIGLVYLVIESPLLNVDHVRVQPTPHLDAAMITRAAAIPRGAPLARVDTGAAEARLEALSWVQSAKVTRHWPGTVRIVVQERVPVAYVRRDAAHVALLSADGTVIADAPGPRAGTVELRGVHKIPTYGARIAPGAVAGIARAMPPALATRVVAVDLTDNLVTLVLDGNATVRLCDAHALAAKGAAASAVLAQLGGATFRYIDVCVPAAPVSG